MRGVVYAIVGVMSLFAAGKVAAADIESSSLREKLAAQEARLKDLQAIINSGEFASGGDTEKLLLGSPRSVFIHPSIPPREPGTLCPIGNYVRRRDTPQYLPLSAVNFTNWAFSGLNAQSAKVW
jgi:hypothetical protein